MNDEAYKMSDGELAQWIERLLTEPMSVVSEALAYQTIITQTDLTQVELATRLGCSQATIANKLRLLKLSDVAKGALERGELTERHGRTILKLDKRKQASVVHKILKQHLTVKETEALVHDLVQKQLDLPTQQALLHDFLKQGMQRLAKQGVMVEQEIVGDYVMLKIIDQSQERKA